jgi:hypothetical protein
MDIIIKFFQSVELPENIRKSVYEYAHLNMNLYFRIYKHDPLLLKNRNEDFNYTSQAYTILDYDPEHNVIGDIFSYDYCVDTRDDTGELLATSCVEVYSDVTEQEVADHFVAAILCGRFPKEYNSQ